MSVLSCCGHQRWLQWKLAVAAVAVVAAMAAVAAVALVGALFYTGIWFGRSRPRATN